jgi:hypothetical protein
MLSLKAKSRSPGWDNTGRLLRRFLSTEYAVTLFFFAVAVLLFYPMLQGQIVAPGDARVYYYPWKMYYGSMLSRGFPLWTPHEFAGISYLGNSESGLFYPPNFFFFAWSSAYSYNLMLLLHYVAAAYFTYLYLKLICKRKLPAVCGGLAFGLAGFMAAHKGHPNMINGATWLPILLYLYEKMRRQPRLSLALIASMVAAAQLFTGHYQVPLYTYIVLLVFILFYLPKQEKGGRPRFLALTCMPLLLGLVIATPQLLATNQLSSVSLRPKNGYTFFTGSSMNPWLFVQFVFPFIYTRSYGKGLYGPGNFTESSGFVGMLMVVFAAIALLRYFRRDRQVRLWFWVGLVALFLMLGSHNPLYRIMWYVPVYRLFRVPTRNVLEFDFALVCLGALGLTHVMQDKQENRRWLLAGIIVPLAAGTFLALLGRTVFNLMVNSKGTAFRQGLEGALRWNNKALLIPMACALGYLVAWALWYHGRELARLAAGALLLVLVLELFSFTPFIDKWYYNIKDVQKEEVSSWKGFLQDTGDEARTLFTGSFAYNMDAVNRDVSLLNGYESLIIESFINLTGLDLPQDSSSWRNLVTDNLTLSMLNCGYVVVEKNRPPLGLESMAISTEDRPAPAHNEIFLRRGWTGVGFTEDEGEVSLAAGDDLAEAYFEQDFPLGYGKRYLVSFDAWADDDFNEGLRVGIALGKVCSPNREVYIKPDYFSPDRRRYLQVVLGPQRIEDFMEEGTLYFMTSSARPIHISDVEIVALDELPLPLVSQRLFDDGGEAEGEDFMPAYRLVYQDKEVMVYRNMNCLPRAFVVRELILVEDEFDMKQRLFLREVDPSVTGMMLPGDIEEVGETRFAPGEVRVVRAAEDRVELEAEMQGDGFVVLSDQYYPGWEARVDGSATPIYRVNGMLRGVKVQAGRHRIEFTYAARPIRASIWFSFSLWVLSLLSVAWLRLSGKGRRLDRRLFATAAPHGAGKGEAGPGAGEDEAGEESAEELPQAPKENGKDACPAPACEEGERRL